MIRSLFILFLCCAQSCLAYTESPSGTFNTDGSKSDVESAISAASAGDTVLVPAGSFDWSGGDGVVEFSGITLHGAGNTVSDTLITDGQIALTKHATELTKLIGFRCVNTRPEDSGNGGHFQVFGDDDDEPFLIGECYFYSDVSYIGRVNCNGGVIYDCDFDQQDDTDASGGNWFHVSLGASGGGGPWSEAHTMGTADTDGKSNVYIEDCTITNFRDGFPDCDEGARVVVRYCTITDSSIITHGGGSGGSGNDTSTYGVRHLEVYTNTFVRASNNMGLNEWVKFRGGSGVIISNAMDDADSPDETSYTGKSEVNLLVGGCDNPAATYPLQYQIGQSTQTPDSTPDNPILIYANTGLASLGVGANDNENLTYTCDDWATFAQSGRDYYTSDTDWSWTAYTYPHPLRSEAAEEPSTDPNGTWRINTLIIGQ